MTLPAHLHEREAAGAVPGEPIAQFELGPLKNFVYLVIDWKTRVAWIVDPQSDLGPPQKVLRSFGLTLSGILLTHTHHDHVAGVPALLKETPGLRVIAGALDHHRLKMPVEAIQDGATILIGSLSLRAMHTPGHSAGEFSYFLEAQEGHPPYLLTGDTVFIRDCGRTDFPDGSNEQMFASLQRIRVLPPETVILPGHHYQAECASTLERELRESPPFGCRSVDELSRLP